MKFTFLYHDGSILELKAEDCKHYSGHAALTNVEVLRHVVLNSNLPAISTGYKFTRLNLALNGQMLGMYPSEE